MVALAPLLHHHFVIQHENDRPEPTSLSRLRERLRSSAPFAKGARERGAAAVEYALLLALIAVAVAAGASALGLGIAAKLGWLSAVIIGGS